MNTQDQQLFDSRWLQIGILVALVVALVAIIFGAAFGLGTGVHADTAKSVAASPLGSSLTAVRKSRLDDYYGRFTNSSAAASTAALAPFYAGLDKGLRDQGIRSSAESSGGLVESSAAGQDQFEWMGFTLPGSVEVKPSAPDQYHFQWKGLTVP